MRVVVIVAAIAGACCLSGCGGGGGSSSSGSNPPDLTAVSAYVGTYSGAALQQAHSSPDTITVTVASPFVDGNNRASCRVTGDIVDNTDFSSPVTEPFFGNISTYGSSNFAVLSGEYSYVTVAGGQFFTTSFDMALQKQSNGTWTGTFTPDSGLPFTLTLTKQAATTNSRPTENGQ